MSTYADIGVIGGSGFYSLLDKAKSISIDTPYGPASDQFSIGKIADKTVAFLPRHGFDHRFPPHKIPYKANLFAFKQLGVKFIISPCASGSLKNEIKPGDFVICDQFVDRTKGREDTFYHGPKVAHIALDEPYCPYLRQIASTAAKKLKYPIHDQGTVVVINGPRFSSRAESEWFSNQGFAVINMTQYPEVVLARELEICFVNISLITDYDVGIKNNPDVKAVSTDEVIKIFKKNNQKIRNMLVEIIKNINIKNDCSCQHALEHAVI
ncbi:MAG: S-methyl-5'-thioadenosine phosphorylase [Candidatus Woesebacteria bacterium]